MKLNPTEIENLKKELGSYRKVAKALGVPIATLLRHKGDENSTKFETEAARVIADFCNYEVKKTPWAPSKKDKHSTSSHSLVFCLSDWHIGEVISRDDALQYNEFNIDIAKRRVEKLTNGFVDLYCSHLSNYKYDALHLFYNGDIINGDIHEELKMYNEFPSIAQAKVATDLICSQVETLASKFPRIHVSFTPGNHDRGTAQSHTAEAAKTSLDYLIGHSVARTFSKTPSVRVNVSESYVSKTKIYDLNVWVEHGHFGASGGGGWIGAVTPIMRSAQKRVAQASAMGERIDLRLIGHYHTHLFVGNTLANGCLSGFGPYAAVNGFSPEPPKQVSAVISSKRGVVADWPIYAD